MTRTTRSLILTAGAMTAAAASPALAQTHSWNNPSGGAWHSLTNWTPFGIPNSAAASVNFTLGGFYTVDIAGADVEVNGFDIANPGARVRVHPGHSLTTHDAFMGVEGTLLIGDAGVSDPAQATWLVAADTLLLGSGSVRLDVKTTGNLPTPTHLVQIKHADALDPSTLTIGPDMTILGRGRFELPVINNGRILADADREHLVMQTGQSKPLHNTGTIIARDGGQITIASFTSNDLSATQSATGRLLADGGVIHLDTTLTGGLLDSANDGAIEGGNYGGISQATILGRLNVGSDHFSIDTPGVTNNGWIALEADFDDPRQEVLYITGDVRIDGEGVVYCEGGFGNAQVGIRADQNSDATLTLGAGQMLIGKAEIAVDTTIEGVFSPGYDVTELTDELSHWQIGDCTLTLAAGSTTMLQIMNDFESSNDRIEPGFNADWSEIVLGGTLIVEDLRGGLEAGESLKIIDLHSVVGEFDQAILPYGYTLTYEPTSVTLHRSAQCVADMALPFGVLDFADVLAFLTAFGNEHASADLAHPAYTFDFADVLAFLSSFGAGCP
ncbi:MAG: GC-type dockerin domain-anchored protein [Phycisphaerales bacterium JB059]